MFGVATKHMRKPTRLFYCSIFIVCVGGSVGRIVKYSEAKIKNDLKFIYEKYGELSTNSITDSHRKYNTISLSACDRLGTKEYLYNLIGKERKTTSFYNWCIKNNHMEFIDNWSYEDNKITPKDISFSEHNSYCMICPDCGTKRYYNINSITNMGVVFKCQYCNSFGKWCIDNKKELLDKIDFSKIDFDIYSIPKGSKKNIWIKCNNSKHGSNPFMIKNITKGVSKCECPKCHSLAQWGIDTFDDDFLEKYWDFDKNDCDPFEIAMTNHSKKIWIKCQDVDYHGSYETKPCDLTATRDRITCPYCYNTRVHKFDSLGYLHPEVLELWSDKNKKSPYEYKTRSAKKVWFKCNCGIHSDTLRKIEIAYLSGFECPDCVKERDESKLEEKVRKYINNNLGYKTLHEHKCTLKPLNPKTNRPLPYDNEIVDIKLIIEVHGLQHYQLSGFAEMSAKKFGTTPEQELNYLQWKDNYKKQYAISNGYYYLEIPYWTEKDETYKILIENKINEILQEVA